MSDTTRASIADTFLEAIRPANRREPKNKIDDQEFAEFVLRMVRRLEERGIENAAILPMINVIAQRLAEVCNVIIAANAARYAVDPMAGSSMIECASVMGISKQAASQRRAIGNRIMGERIEAAGAVRFSEAKREREALAAAINHAIDKISDEITETTRPIVTSLDAYRAKHAA